MNRSLTYSAKSIALTPVEWLCVRRMAALQRTTPDDLIRGILGFPPVNELETAEARLKRAHELCEQFGIDPAVAGLRGATPEQLKEWKINERINSTMEMLGYRNHKQLPTGT